MFKYTVPSLYFNVLYNYLFKYIIHLLWFNVLHNLFCRYKSLQKSTFNQSY